MLVNCSDTREIIHFQTFAVVTVTQNTQKYFPITALHRVFYSLLNNHTSPIYKSGFDFKRTNITSIANLPIQY